MKQGAKSRPSIPHHLLGLIAAFVIATASFVGSALYADSQLGAVARRSHAVSDNAMPSLFRLGVMRRESLEVVFILNEASEGSPAPLSHLPSHWRSIDEAARAYALLPRFPGEGELWRATSADMGRMRRVADAVEGLAAARRFREAEEVETRDLEPVARQVDAGLLGLLRLNGDQGARTAAEADALWLRARRTSLALCGISVALTAALAVNAFRNARRYEVLQRDRADEMEAFAARVAHDLRGPLSPASLSIQAVQRTLAEADPRRATLERGRRNLQHLESLISDLLAFARAGASPERKASAGLREIVADVVHDLEPQAQQEGVRVAVEDMPPCRLACAPGVLASILLNLVGNSLKHMPSDAIDKTVSVRGSRGDRRLVHVEVADTGQGLPPGDPKRLFEPYVRASEARPGLGLGLATVRRLVEAHGGSVGALSNQGAGATFWFELPET